MKKFFLFIFILFCSNSLFSQTGTINGLIKDKDNNQVIEGAFATLSDVQFITVSDKDGFFSFNKIPAGKYILKITFVGYKNYETEIILETKEIITLYVKLEPSYISTGDINVSSVRFESPVKNVTLPLSVVSRDDILKNSYFTVSDAVNNKAGISLVRDGIWATDISIRGLNRNNIVTLIDGNRIETSNDIASRLSLVNVSDIQRIEVIKGASSSLYGSGAIGGIINIITNASGYHKNFHIGGSITSIFNSVNTGISNNLNLNSGAKNWYLKINSSLQNSKNTSTPSGDIKNSQYHDYSITSEIGLIPFKNNEIKILYQNYRGGDIGIPGASVLFSSIADVRYLNVSREMFSAEYKINQLFKGLLDISLKYFIQNIIRDVENIPYTVQKKPATQTQPAQRISILKILPTGSHKTMGGVLQSNWKISKNYNLITGLDIWQRKLNTSRERVQKIEILDSTGNSVINTTYKTTGETPIPDSKYQNIGAFSQNELNLINNKLKLSAGVRFDYIKISNEEAFNPAYEIINGVRNNSPAGQKIIWNSVSDIDESISVNTGALYSIYRNVDVNFNFGYSFRSPSLEERYQYIDLGNLIRVGNPSLHPERGYFIDLGVRIWKNTFSFNGDLFLNYFTDLVTEVTGIYESRPALIKINISKARLFGFDFEAMYNFYKNFVLYGSSSYVRGKDIETNMNLPQIPPLNGRIGMKTQLFNLINFDLSSMYFFEQSKIASGETVTPGYVTFNINAGLNPVNIGFLKLHVFAGVDNILDKSYRNHLSTTRGSITTEPGRNVYMKLKIEY